MLSREGKNSVIACLRGGLGNQMFEYAAGRNALKTGSRLVCDSTGFILSLQRRVYGLEGFRVKNERFP